MSLKRHGTFSYLASYLIRPSVVIVPALALVGCSQPGVPVTGTNGTDIPRQQSETASTTSFARGQDLIVVTYNDETNSDENIIYTSTTRKILKGASLMGWSYSSDQGKSWHYGGKLQPPAGWSVLWGDPAITTSNGSYHFVFMSNLAIPDSKMPTGEIDGSVQISGADSYIGGACIARSSDGGKTFSIYQCVSNTTKNNVPNSDKGHFYDGGSMASSSSGEIYAAFNDVATSQIDVWRSPNEGGQFVPLPPPFPGLSIESHPRIRVNRSDGTLYVAAQAANGVIFINRYLGGQWGSPVVASDPAANQDESINFGPGLFIRVGPQFSFAIGAASDDNFSDAIRFLYTRRDSDNGRFFVTGSFCPLSLSPGCQRASEWGTTPGNLNTPGDQFNPNVEAWGGFFGLPPAWKATYYDRSGAQPNAINLQQGNLAYLPNGTRIFLPFDLVKNMVVCPDNRGYWGDYDNLLHIGFEQGSSTALFLRTFSDSSLGCDQRWDFTSHNLHVRSVAFQ